MTPRRTRFASAIAMALLLCSIAPGPVLADHEHERWEHRHHGRRGGHHERWRYRSGPDYYYYYTPGYVPAPEVYYYAPPPVYVPPPPPPSVGLNLVFPFRIH